MLKQDTKYHIGSEELHQYANTAKEYGCDHIANKERKCTWCDHWKECEFLKLPKGDSK